LNVGPYDIALAKEELLQMAESEHELRTQKEMLIDKHKLIRQRKKEVSEELVEKLTKMQRENMQKDLDQWQKGEKNTSKNESLDDVISKGKKQYDYDGDNVL
jgi:hypothetical protein